MIERRIARAIRQCIFCGGSPLTKEHIIPEWLSRLVIPPVGPVYISESRRVRDQYETTPPRSRARSRILDVIGKQVCSACNTGWMSDLEAATQTILTPVARGVPAGIRIPIQAHAQRTIARWAVKTAVLLQYRQSPPERADPQLLQRIQAKPTPPPNAAVWIGEYAGSSMGRGSLRTVFLRQPNSASNYAEVKVFTLGVGHLALQAAIANAPGSITIQAREELQSYFTAIFPGNGQVIYWPPLLPLDDATFSGWENRFRFG